MVCIEEDFTILRKDNQTDYWTTGHVLYGYFLMQMGWTWWAVLLVVIFYEFCEAVGIHGSTTVPDGLVVDPVQGLMGAIVFLVLKRLGCVRSHWREEGWAGGGYGLDWGKVGTYVLHYFLLAPMILVSMVGERDGGVPNDQKDWAFFGACSVMSLYNAWELERGATWWQRCGSPAYVVSFSGMVVGLNRIPYNPWLGSVYFHSLAFLAWLVFLAADVMDFLEKPREYGKRFSWLKPGTSKGNEATKNGFEPGDYLTGRLL